MAVSGETCLQYLTNTVHDLERPDFATGQFRRVLKTLGESEFPEGYRSQWGVLVGIIVSVLGSALAISLFFTYN